MKRKEAGIKRTCGLYIVGNEWVPKYSSMSHCEYQMVKCESGQEAKKCEYIYFEPRIQRLK